MKIRLKNTKLSDENKNPIPFFHVTPCQEIEHFLPLSHFGTQQAARMRAMHFVYQDLGRPEPVVLPKKISSDEWDNFVRQSKVPLKMHVVRLAVKSPLRIPDLNRHSLEQYYQWFLYHYTPKQQYLTGSERCEGDVVGPARIKYKNALANFIFLDPFTKSEQDLKQEISSDSFYSAHPKMEESDSLPAFLFPVIKKMNKKLYPLGEKVALQRMMRYLEGEGYDAFVYQNTYEDKGQNSYIIFRPEQVFFPSETTTEHTISDKKPEQKSFLQDLELKFFERFGILSPSQRIQKNLQEKLQKRKVQLKNKRVAEL